MTDAETAFQIANGAMMRIESHEEQCRERYEQIVKNQERSEQDRREMKTSIEAGQAVLRTTISTGHEKIYGLMWRLMFFMFSTLIAVAGTLGLLALNWMLTRGGIN